MPDATDVACQVDLNTCHVDGMSLISNVCLFPPSERLEISRARPKLAGISETP